MTQISQAAMYVLPTLLGLLSLGYQTIAQKQMQGTWEVVSETWAGWQLPDELRAKEVTIQANVFAQKFKNHTDEPGKDRFDRASVRHHPLNVPPALDLVDQDMDMEWFSAIFKFDPDKDTLTICYVIRRSLDRPTEFTSTKENTNAILVLKRKKAP
jgi:uncharacterized protein (TIGR03067 family)